VNSTVIWLDYQAGDDDDDDDDDANDADDVDDATATASGKLHFPLAKGNRRSQQHDLQQQLQRDECGPIYHRSKSHQQNIDFSRAEHTQAEKKGYDPEFFKLNQKIASLLENVRHASPQMKYLPEIPHFIKKGLSIY